MHHIKPHILKPDERKRIGRGFSREELKKAGISLAVARAIELPIDMRRRTAHDDNVEAIKAYAAKEKAERKAMEKTETAAEEKPEKQAKRKA
jgi:large subunit ribosomal protein L13e